MTACGSAAELAQLRTVQQLLHAFSETPSCVVLLSTALGEMLGVLARQQACMNEILVSLQATREECMRELSAVSQNLADVLHDTINRTAAAMSEVREKISRQHCTYGTVFFSKENRIELKKEIVDLRQLVQERLHRQNSSEAERKERNSAIDAELAATRVELRDLSAQQHLLLELLDLRKTLLYHGYTGDSAADVRQIRLLDTVARVKLVHQLPCFHVLTTALALSDGGHSHRHPGGVKG
ncbi:hypothetical protein TraAM80_03765 [Trypanosoma rangeli]|uniref:Uncharacterized protein n=1 Tax=Trypanosoma rangeli TaxID=5698 RepID=A0A422NML4_TRYRA|nr:uncharacterized protein TraAM80_03765 [Trypanosoma rangeli]RNF06742.1 hypothetical protein TraAM80_03765 [Trypanosoma rangeli]|eukprot:RNF06742.1 hypothetical protein TraAM80_03765 [Trypanosoma rangeli]